MNRSSEEPQAEVLSAASWAVHEAFNATTLTATTAAPTVRPTSARRRLGAKRLPKNAIAIPAYRLAMTFCPSVPLTQSMNDLIAGFSLAASVL